MSVKVPESIRPKYDEIIAIIDDVCATLLNEEVATLAHKATLKLARKRPSPLVNGKAASWAGGILYAQGQVNVLFGPSKTPHVKHADLASAVVMAQQTLGNKAHIIRDMLKMNYMNADWLLSANIQNNPAIWWVSSDGMIVDIRRMPRVFQEMAMPKGIVPIFQMTSRLKKPMNMIKIGWTLALSPPQVLSFA